MHGVTYLAFNTTDPILGNPKVREAFRYLIDYDGLAKTILAYKGAPRAEPRAGRRVRRARRKAEGQPFKLDLDKAKRC